MRESKSSSGGIGTLGALFLIFLALKLAGVDPVANWSWWLVTAPLWGGLAVAVAVLIIFVSVMLWFDR